MNSLNSRIRVALVEDDRPVREGLESLVRGAEGFEFVGAFSSAEEALARLPELAADIVLMDIRLPGMSGIECIAQLKSRLSRIQIMMLTVFEDHDRIFQSLAAGASGYLLKQTPQEKLLEAIRELSQGGSPMSAQIARRVVETFQNPPSSQDEEMAARLSPRETEIIRLLAKGFLYKEIADQLRLSVETVRTHIHNIYEKLHVRTRTEAVMKMFGRDRGF
jgi:DNA-binding NarL/FixJ family response regulator